MKIQSAIFLYLLGIVIVLFYMLSDYPYFDIHISFFVFSVIYIGYQLLKEAYKDGIFSLAVIFNLFGLLYTHYYMFELILEKEVIEEYVYIAMELSTIAIISFNTAYNKTSIPKTKNYQRNSNIFNVNYFTKLITALFIVSVAAEFYVIFVHIGIYNYLLASRAEQSLLRSDVSFLTFYNHTIPVIASISLYLYLEFGGKFRCFLFLSSFTITILSAIISVSRADLFSVVLPILFILNYYKKISNKITIILGIVGIALFGVWKSLFSDEIQIQYDSEFVSWYHIIENVLNDRNFSFCYGESYVKTIINLVIPVTGMEPLSVWYVRNYLPEVYLAGGGRGFSSVLEAYMNFHIFGVIFIYSIYGYWAKKLRPNTPIKIMLYMMVIVSINMLFRSESYAFWKNMMWHKIYPILLFYYLASKSNKKYGIK